MMPPTGPPPLTNDTIRNIASLARLHVEDAQLDDLRARLGAVVQYMERLKRLDLTGVEPMAHVRPSAAGSPGPHAPVNRLDADAPSAARSLAGRVPTLTPHTYDDAGQTFIRVPKVLGEGGA